MYDDAFQVSAPWRLDRKAKIVVTVRDNDLFGSTRHVLRFDLYPLYAPSHPERHHAFWDIPMKHIRREMTVLTLRKERLALNGIILPRSFRPAWRGELPLSGTCTLAVSILDMGSQPPRTSYARTSMHLLPGTSELPLVRATLYLTRRCNLRCDMCLRESYQSLDNSDAPPEVVDAVVEESSRLASVLLHGDGEPLLHPELLNILARLKRAMPPEGKVGLLTNGTLLNQDMARALVDRGLDWLTLSIDGATKSTVEHIRRGSHFETIVENLRHGVEYGRRTRPGGIQFTFQFTMRGSNVQEFPDLVKLAGRLGVDNVTSSILRDFGTGKFLPVPASALDVVYAEAILAAREQGVNLTLQPPRPLEQLQCNFLQEAYVHVSGNVGGCCFREPGHSERPLHILGNVKEMPLSEIWNSPRSRDLRRKLMAGNFPERCSVCEDKERGFPLKA